MEDRTLHNWLSFVTTSRNNNKTPSEFYYVKEHKISETEAFKRIIEKMTPSI